MLGRRGSSRRSPCTDWRQLSPDGPTRAGSGRRSRRRTRAGATACRCRVGLALPRQRAARSRGSNVACSSVRRRVFATERLESSRCGRARPGSTLRRSGILPLPVDSERFCPEPDDRWLARLERSDRRVRRPRRRSAQEPRARARRAAAAPPPSSRRAVCGSSDRRPSARRRRRVARRSDVGGRAAPRGVATRASVAPGGIRHRRCRSPRERRTRRVDAVRRSGGAARAPPGADA